VKARKRAAAPSPGGRSVVGPVPPLYRVFRTLERRMRDHRYKQDERLPSEDELLSRVRRQPGSRSAKPWGGWSILVS
jgi:hypothetical protein